MRPPSANQGSRACVRKKGALTLPFEGMVVELGRCRGNRSVSAATDVVDEDIEPPVPCAVREPRAQSLEQTGVGAGRRADFGLHRECRDLLLRSIVARVSCAAASLLA